MRSHFFLPHLVLDSIPSFHSQRLSHLCFAPGFDLEGCSVLFIVFLFMRIVRSVDCQDAMVHDIAWPEFNALLPSLF